MQHISNEVRIQPLLNSYTITTQHTTYISYTIHIYTYYMPHINTTHQIPHTHTHTPHAAHINITVYT